jgi:hypothetical protein
MGSAGRIIWIGVLLGIGFMIAQSLPQFFAGVLDTGFQISVGLIYELSWLWRLIWRFTVFNVCLCGGLLVIALVWACIEQTFKNWRRARHLASMRKRFAAELEISLKRDVPQP